jgi:hypothetical protein
MFEHDENGLTIPIDYSPINQLFHKLGHLLMSPSNLSATIFIQDCQFQELRLNFWNDFFSQNYTTILANDLVKKRNSHNYVI